MPPRKKSTTTKEPKIPALKPLARGGYGATVRAGRYPQDYAVEAKAGTEIQFRLRLVTAERVEGQPGAIPERVQSCYERLLTMRDQLVKAERGLEAEQLMRDAALHIDKPALFDAALQVASMIPDLPPPDERSEWDTWGKVANAWTTGALRRRFPGKQITEKSSTSKDEGIVAWLEPFIGSVPLETFNEQHYDRAMGNLPERAKSDGAKRHYAQVIMRVMRLAKKCRLLKTWHLDGVEVWKVEKKNRPVFTCLFPADLDKLLPCPELEYKWRMLWGFMIWESPRIGYLPSVTWADVETDGSGGIGMNSKSGEWLSWDLRPGTLRALLHMRVLYPELAGPFAWMQPIDVQRAAETLREHLLIAGVADARLHETTGRRRRMRAHDMRATFVVFAKIEGRSEDWIMDRTGHTTSDMVRRYDRQERKARGKGWRPLGRLDDALGLANSRELVETTGEEVAAAPRELPAAAPRELPAGDDGADADDEGARASSPTRPDAVTGPVTAPEGSAAAGTDGGKTQFVPEPVTRAVTVSGNVRSGIEEGEMQVHDSTGSGHCSGAEIRTPIQGFKVPQSATRAPNLPEDTPRDTPEATGSDVPSRAAVTPRAAYAAALKRAMVAAIEAESLDHLPELTRLFEAAKSAAGGAKVVELALRRGSGG
jgi:hypothetical protein